MLGPAFFDWLAPLVEHRPNPPGHRTGDDGIATMQCPSLHDDGGDRTAAAVELRLDHRPRGACRGVGRVVLEFGDEVDVLEQMVDALSGESGYLSAEDVATQGLDHEAVLGELSTNVVRVAESRSILLMATTIGTPAALAWLMASTVWGMTPSLAATTSTTMSVTSAPRGAAR